MPPRDTAGLILATDSAAETLPDPAAVAFRTHRLVNTFSADAVWSSVGATPFTDAAGANVATLTVPRGASVQLQSDGIRWVVKAEPAAAALAEGMAVLAAAVNLQATPSGAWTPTPLTVALPEPGVYHLDAVVRMAISASVLIGGTNVWGEARLFDVTAGAVVPNSESICCQVILGGIVATAGGNQDGMIAVRHTIAVPSVIRVDAQRTNSAGATSSASVNSDGAGRTTLRYKRVA